jgi:predicted phosphodiesterase
MRTAIVSDLHLGITSVDEVACVPEARERLLRAVEGADRVVLLGDTLELREQPVARVLERAGPLFEELGEATAGKRVVIVPGNHDHELAEPWLTRLRLNAAKLDVAAEWPVDRGGGLAGRLAERMPRTEVTVAYPGLRLRPDVYATHGHYIDVELTVPRLECIAASTMARLTGRGEGCRTPGDYEAVLAPLYAFYYHLVQGRTGRPLHGSSRLSRSVWGSANGAQGGTVARLLLGRITIPGAVAILNRAGLGPFGADISGAELRRAGLRAMAEVVTNLGVEADHVIFGHTHRPGPLLGDNEGWSLANGTRLWNTGSWLYESVFLDRNRDSSYWPGTVIYLEDQGPPEVTNSLDDLELPGKPKTRTSAGA